MTKTFDAVGIIAADMARSLAFYRRLGLSIPAEKDSEQHVDVATGGGVRLMFDTEAVIRSFDPAWEPPTPGQRIGLAFRCDSPAEVDSTYADLVGAGYAGHLEPFDAVWGQRYASVGDADGNPVDLYAPTA